MRQTRTTIKELTARYRAVLIKCLLMNAVLFSGATTVQATETLNDGTNTYIGTFGIPLTVYDNDASAGTFYSFFWTPIGNASISDETASLNNNSRVGSFNLSETKTGTHAEVSALTSSQISTAVDNIITVLTNMNTGAKDFNALPDGIKEALNVLSYGGGQTVKEFLLENHHWGDGSRTALSNEEIGVIRNALNNDYAGFNDHFSIPQEWDATVSIENSTLTLNGTSAIVNRAEVYPGTISINNSTVITNGTNALETYSGLSTNISFTGSSLLQVNSGSTLTITSSGNRVSLNNSNLTVNGTITGNVSLNGTTALKGTGTISGNLDAANASVLNMQNSTIDSITAGTVTGGNFSVALDVNPANGGGIDHFTADSFTTGTITISGLNFLSEERNFTLTVLNGTTTNATLVLSSAVDAAYNTGGTREEWRSNLTPAATWATAFIKTKYTIETSKTLAVQNNKTLKFTIVDGAETQGETVSLGDTVKVLNTMDAAVRTMTNNTSVVQYAVTENLGTTAAGTFTVNGLNTSSSPVVNMNAHTGFSVADGATLNLKYITFTGNTDAAGSVLTVAGGTADLLKVIIPNTVSVTSGTLTLSGMNLLGGLNNDGTVILTGANGVGAIGGTGTLTNNGNMTLTGTTNGQAINGSGRTYVNNALTTTAEINQAITINNNKSLTANADNIGGIVTNKGLLSLTGGTLGQTVSGGTIQINGDVVSNVDLGNVTINSGKKLTINAGYVDNTFRNNGTLALSGGMLNTAVSGTVQIAGDVTSNVPLSNTTVNGGKRLTIAAGNVGTNLANQGTVVLTAGTLNNTLSGAGNVQINGNVVSNVDLENVTINSGRKLTINAGYADNTFTNNGILALSGGTLNTAVSGAIQIVGNVASEVLMTDTTINSGKRLTIAADNVGTNLTNNGTLVLTNGTLRRILSGTGNVQINGDVVSNVDLGNVTINSGRKLTINAGYVDNTFRNNGILALSGGTLNTAVSGTVQIVENVMSNVLLSNTTINSGKTLTIAANHVGGGFTNNGILALSGGTLNTAVSGTVQIAGDVTSNVPLSNTTINGGKTLTIAAGNIGDNLTNNGILALSGGTLNTAVSGTVQIAGDVTSNVLMSNTTINRGRKLTIAANHVGGGFTNNGILALSGGTLNTAVAGAVQIVGDVTSNVLLSNTMISGGKTLTIAAGNVGTNLANNGTLALSGGTLNTAVVGVGTIRIVGDVTSNVLMSNTTINGGKTLTIAADNIGYNLTNNGMLALSGGTLNNTPSGTGNIRIAEDVVSKAALSNVTIDNGKTLTLSADHVGGGFTNNGTVVLTGGEISRPLSGNITVTGYTGMNDGADFSNAQINLTEGILSIGENTLTANTLTGGTVALDLKEFAAAETLVTATPSGTVTLEVWPFSVTSKAVQHYTLTSTNAGYSMDFILPSFYAVSTTPFEKENAMDIPEFDRAAQEAWEGGDLYVVALNVAEIAVSELGKNGYAVTTDVKNTTKKLSDDLEDILSGEHQNNYQRVNMELIYGFLFEDYGRIKTVLDETGTDATPATVQTAQTNAQAVMSVVSSRLGGGSPVKGRSGGDFVAGDSAVWAQGMLNKAKLSGENGFTSDSTGFAAGFEHNINDSYKAGIGYAFASTDIKTGQRKTKVDTHTFFAYGEYKPDAFFVNGTLGYGSSSYNEKTKYLGLKSDYKADTLSAQTMAGYAFEYVTPEAGLRYTNVKEKAYTDALGAKISEKTSQTWTVVAGARTAKDFLFEKGTLSARANAALTYDLKQGDTNKTVSLANGANYVVQGKNMERFGAEIGAGVSYKLNGKTDIGISYEGKFKKKYADHTGMINFRYTF